MHSLTGMTPPLSRQGCVPGTRQHDKVQLGWLPWRHACRTHGKWQGCSHSCAAVCACTVCHLTF